MLAVDSPTHIPSPAFAITYPFAGQTLTPGVTYLFQWSTPTQPTCLLRFRYVNAASVGLLSPIPNISDSTVRQNSSLGAVNYTVPTLNQFQTAGTPGLEYALFNQGTTTLGLRATGYNSTGSPVTPSANIVIYMRGKLGGFHGLNFPHSRHYLNLSLPFDSVTQHSRLPHNIDFHCVQHYSLYLQSNNNLCE